MLFFVILVLAATAVQNGQSSPVALNVTLDVDLSKLPVHCTKASRSCSLQATVWQVAIDDELSFHGGENRDQIISLSSTNYKYRSFSGSANVQLDTTSSFGVGRHLYLAIKLMHLPIGSQDLFIVDLSRAATHHMGVFKMRVQSGHMSMHVRATRQQKLSSPFGCQCVGHTCGCCEHFDVSQLDLNETGCVNVTYLPADIGAAISFSINDHILFSEEISVRNPPPVCFDIPMIKDLAKACIRFYDVTATDSALHACVDVELELAHVKLANVKLGCFNIGPLHGRKRMNLL